MTRILSVDDYAPSLYTRRRMLTAAGYEVVNATTATQALELAAFLEPDLILLDVDLPDGNGLDLCRTLKTSSWAAGIKIVCISAAFPAETTAAWAVPYSRADAYLTDGGSPDVLLETIRRLT